MRIVIRHDEAGEKWWWAAVGENGDTAAVSALYGSRTECQRAVAELKVEGPSAPITYEERYAASPAMWTISSLMPSGS